MFNFMSKYTFVLSLLYFVVEAASYIGSTLWNNSRHSRTGAVTTGCVVETSSHT